MGVMSASMCAGIGPASAALQQRVPSRTFIATPCRRACARPGRLQVANIAAPARPPLMIPSIVPDEALIDEVRGWSSAQCRRTLAALRLVWLGRSGSCHLRRGVFVVNGSLTPKALVCSSC